MPYTQTQGTGVASQQLERLHASALQQGGKLTIASLMAGLQDVHQTVPHAEDLPACQALKGSCLRAGQQSADGWGAACQDMIRRLLVTSPAGRLGSGPSGVRDIFGHSFFDDFPWDDLLHGAKRARWRQGTCQAYPGRNK